MTNRLILSTACFLGFEWIFSDLILNSKFVSDLFRTEHSCCFLIIPTMRSCNQLVRETMPKRFSNREKVVCCIAAAQVIIFYSKLFYRFSIQKLFCFFAHANFFSFVSSFFLFSFFYFRFASNSSIHRPTYLCNLPKRTTQTTKKFQHSLSGLLIHLLIH